MYFHESSLHFVCIAPALANLIAIYFPFLACCKQGRYEIMIDNSLPRELQETSSKHTSQKRK